MRYKAELDELANGLPTSTTAYMPDITTVAKPIADGIPMGAMLCTDKRLCAFTPGMHGTTFGGGPLACAVAIAVIDTISERTCWRISAKLAAIFKREAADAGREHDCIIDVRGMGLMLGLELNSAELAESVTAQMMERKHHHQPNQ